MLRFHPLPTLVRAAAASVALTGSLTLFSLIMPLSPVAHWTSRYLPLAYVHASRADAALKHETPDLRTAEAETLSELSISPMQTSAWLRIAFIDVRRNGSRLDGRGIDALRHSYLIDPFDTNLGLWRLALAFDHWPQLDALTRVKAIQETAGLWSIGWLRSSLHQMPAQISQPAGRLAAGLQIKRLESSAIHD